MKKALILPLAALIGMTVLTAAPVPVMRFRLTMDAPLLVMASLLNRMQVCWLIPMQMA